MALEMILSRDKPIGIFDSGIGGLTVLKEIQRELPLEDLIYLGDTARVPYGTRSPETVTRYSFENTGFLVSHGIKLLVVACNTASSISLEAIKAAFSVPVIGVIEPGARAAVRATRNKRIGVIGTEATIKSGSYQRAIRAINSGVRTITTPCPLFVPLVEEGWLNEEVTYLVAKKYLSHLIEEDIDTLVLGCTHYPLLKIPIERVMGDGMTLIDSAVEPSAVGIKFLVNFTILISSGILPSGRILTSV